jgi:Domain of unknown function (DUF4167)
MRVSSNRRPRGGRSGSSGGRPGPSNNRGSGNNRRPNNGNRSYDSNGPDGKIRGSATQVYDKYMSLGRDAQTSGNPVAAENYFQHAEHYFRIMLANNLVKPERTAEDGSDQSPNDSSSSGETRDNVASTDASANAKSDKSEAEPAVEPIIIDLSDPEPIEIQLPTPPEDDDSSEKTAEPTEENSAPAEDDDGDRPKTKRRVSRSRGLRRRAPRKNTEGSSDQDEPQSAE